MTGNPIRIRLRMRPGQLRGKASPPREHAADKARPRCPGNSWLRFVGPDTATVCHCWVGVDKLQQHCMFLIAQTITKQACKRAQDNNFIGPEIQC
jgi:hypothetical protein